MNAAIEVHVRIRGVRRLKLITASWVALRKLRLVSADRMVAAVNAAIARTDVQVQRGAEWQSLGPAQITAAKITRHAE